MEKRKNVDKNALLDELQRIIEEEMKMMTLARGRQLLKESGDIIYQVWNMKGALIFDTFAKAVGREQMRLPDNIELV